MMAGDVWPHSPAHTADESRAMMFRLESPFQPAGDQPEAIAALVEGLRDGRKFQVLMGVTGSGKTFTMANVIQQLQRPTLVISHNKTLAAQLYAEFKEFFPHNAVHYFVSYYDYYQPEAYIPQRDIYIEKDASINEEIDRLRLAATSALVSRRDVIIVASVSCIYGLGSPEDYRKMMVALRVGDVVRPRRAAAASWSTSSTSGTTSRSSGQVSACGATASRSGRPTRSSPSASSSGATRSSSSRSSIRPAARRRCDRKRSCSSIRPSTSCCPRSGSHGRSRRSGRSWRSGWSSSGQQGKLLEAQRLSARTRFDIEMLLEVGYCPGIENYSRPLSRPAAGFARPTRCSASFPTTSCCSSTSRTSRVPQIRGMYAGDRSRKVTLVEHGFRLPSALDNRPLTFEEWEERIRQVIFVSATPGALRAGADRRARSSSRSFGRPACWTR